MKLLYFAVVAAMVMFNNFFQAHADNKRFVCGDGHDLQVCFDVDWVSRLGSATLEGDTVVSWLNAEAVQLECIRQGGSSMQPWWTCTTVVNGQDEISLSLVDTTEPASAKVRLKHQGDVIAERQVSCVAP